MKITLIRHGKTQGNINMEYIGRTDQPLCEIGIAELKTRKYPKADIVFSSPLKRCRQTTQLIYPDMIPVIKTDLQEGDFGDFEGKTFEDLKDNIDYRNSIDSGGEIPFPNGEDLKKFKKRCQDEFIAIVREANLVKAKAISIVAHGGTIMSILSAFSDTNKEFYSWQVKNAKGYLFDFDIKSNIANNIEEL